MATTEQQRDTERSLIRELLLGVFDDSEQQRSDYNDRDFIIGLMTLSVRATINLAETIEAQPPGGMP